MHSGSLGMGDVRVGEVLSSWQLYTSPMFEAMKGFMDAISKLVNFQYD